MLTTKRLASHFSAGTHGSTFGGNPLGCSVANKAIELIDNTKFLNNVKLRGKQLKDGLLEINSKCKIFQEIRGTGLLVGAVLNNSFSGKAGLIVNAGYKEGIITLTAGGDVLRFAPPLIISSKTLKKALGKLEIAIKKFIDIDQPL